MRKSRLRTYRKKNKTFITVMKLVAIWYGCTLTVTFLSSSTSASFISSQKETIELQAGNWWDGSILEFTSSSEEVNACSSTEISIQLMNKGFSMIGPTTYEVYHAGGTEPIQVGEVGPILAGSTAALTYLAGEGSYVFKAYQRPMFEGNTEIWSETITVACIEEEQEEKTENGENKEEENTEKNPEEHANPSGQTPVEGTKEEEPVESKPEETPESEDENVPEESNDGNVGESTPNPPEGVSFEETENK